MAVSPYMWVQPTDAEIQPRVRASCPRESHHDLQRADGGDGRGGQPCSRPPVQGGEMAGLGVLAGCAAACPQELGGRCDGQCSQQASLRSARTSLSEPLRAAASAHQSARAQAHLAEPEVIRAALASSHVADIWDDFDADEKRKAIALVVARIEVLKARDGRSSKAKDRLGFTGESKIPRLAAISVRRRTGRRLDNCSTYATKNPTVAAVRDAEMVRRRR
jgi:hypothetical protein